MVNLRSHQGELTSPVDAIEAYFEKAGVSIVQAAFAHSYFIHPDSVRGRTPYFRDRARRSREHYPGVEKGKPTTWHLGDGREIFLDDNSRAQMAWERYTGRRLMRGSGYGVRHIWGNTHDPTAFTAGWNLCYMPFWAGMLTEDQHPHPQLQRAIRQASWDLFFSDAPVCDPPSFVKDPGLDLPDLLAGQPLLILDREAGADGERSHAGTRRTSPAAPGAGIPDQVRAIKIQTHQSWSSIRKAARSLQGLDHEPFGTPNVENSAKSCVRKIQREVGLSFAEIEDLLIEQGW